MFAVKFSLMDSPYGKLIVIYIMSPVGCLFAQLVGLIYLVQAVPSAHVPKSAFARKGQ